MVCFVKLEQPLTPSTSLNQRQEDNDFEETNINEFSKDDYTRLIQLIEPCRPIWDHKMNLSDRSDSIKEKSWNQIFVDFEGKLMQIHFAINLQQSKL